VGHCLSPLKAFGAAGTWAWHLLADLALFITLSWIPGFRAPSLRVADNMCRSLPAAHQPLGNQQMVLHVQSTQSPVIPFVQSYLFVISHRCRRALPRRRGTRFRDLTPPRGQELDAEQESGPPGAPPPTPPEQVPILGVPGTLLVPGSDLRFVISDVKQICAAKNLSQQPHRPRRNARLATCTMLPWPRHDERP
jgi:hypothetical protein